MTEMQQKCGFVGLIGEPNAGKSTLLNQLVGSKIAIVTPKVQTTRHLIRGIEIVGDTQCIYVDTPGIFNAQKTFEKAMVDNAWMGAKDADVVALLIDATRALSDHTKAILEKVKHYTKPKAIILNKIDLVEKQKLLELTKQISEHASFDQLFMVSARNGDGVDDVRQWFASQLPEGPWLFPEDQMSDLPIRFLAAEITREKLFLRLREELPYGLTVENELWQERDDDSVRINQLIIVERETHKKIVLGKGGQQLKSVGQAARQDIQKMLGCTVHLFLFVKVVPGWKEKKEYLPVL